jgi:hypothetical protein
MRNVLLLATLLTFGCGSPLSRAPEPVPALELRAQSHEPLNEKVAQESAPGWLVLPIVANPIDDTILRTLSRSGEYDSSSEARAQGDKRSGKSPPSLEIRRSDELEIVLRYWNLPKWIYARPRITVRTDKNTAVVVNDAQFVQLPNGGDDLFYFHNPDGFLAELINGKVLLIQVDYEYASEGPGQDRYWFDLIGLAEALPAID